MKIKKLNEKKTLAVSMTCPVEELPNVLGKAFGDVMTLIKKRKSYPAGAPFVIYRNDDMSALQIEAGTLPGGLCAVARHKGPYNTVKETYSTLMSFIKEKGHEPAGPCFEVYINDPQKVKPEKLKTDIVFVLKR